MSKNLKRSKGFTLIELLTTVAIVGILGAVAYPSYTSHLTRSNRTEGQRELLRTANLMEQYFLDHRTYTSDMTKLGLSASPFITNNKNYKIQAVASSVSASKYQLTAVAINKQATNDSACANLYVDQTGKRTATSSDCWEK